MTAPSSKDAAASPSAPSSVPMLDIGRGNRELRDEILQAIADVYDSGRFLYGPDVSKLEAAVAAVCDTRHAVGCASGSDALLLSLMAFDVGPGDEVIAPSFTFFATASCIHRLGAKIVFVDVDPVTFNIDPALLEQAITPATKAIIPVHLFGQCADMDPIMEIANRHGLKVIEDLAQAIGAEYHDRPAGSIGDVGCISFYPTKNLGGCGDGGMLTTNDDDIADQLRKLSAHGMRPRYYHSVVGINSRLDTFQAAALNVKIAHLGRYSNDRRENAKHYGELFAEAGLESQLVLPQEMPGQYHVWNQYTIRVLNGRRDKVRAYLGENKIGSDTYYPVPLHMQECFQDVGCGLGSLPVTELLAGEVMSLPIFPELTRAEQTLTVQRIGEALRIERAAA